MKFVISVYPFMLVICYDVIECYSSQRLPHLQSSSIDCLFHHQLTGATSVSLRSIPMTTAPSKVVDYLN